MAAPRPGVWGIDLGQCALKAIRLENVDGQVTATAFDYIEHPKILSQPDADPDQLTREALEQFLSRNKVQGDMVVISVPGQSGLARFVKLPPVEEKKVADIVKFEAKQQIPFPLEEVVWDFQKIGTGTVTDGFALETEIGLFAMKRDMVNRYLQHFKEVNIDVHIVQMAPLALCNSVSYDLLGKDNTPGEGTSEKKCVVGLDIGTDNSNLVITDGEKIIWQRPIPLGGNHFTRALTKDLKLTFAKAEHLKRNAVKSPDLKKILSALKTVLNDFVGEVQRSLGYFTNTHRDAQIQYMVGMGNAFRLPGLQKFLQEKLQLEVRKLTKLERLVGDEVVGAPQFTENILSFGVAYGLALQGLGLPRLQTNLLPYEIRVERLVRAKKPWAAAAAAVLILGAGGLTFARSIEARALNPKNPAVEKANAEAKRVKGILSDFQNKYNDAERRYNESIKSIERIGSGVGYRMNWNLLLQFINMSLPRPDGTRLSVRTRLGVEAQKVYATDKAHKAYLKVEEKRHSKAPPQDAKAAAREDEMIKKNLIQINIEGIDALYSDDLIPYFKRIADEHSKVPIPGMDPDEEKKIREKPADLPKKGWLFEIRGYTHHKDGPRFVIATLLENLHNPGAIQNELSDEMQKKIKDRMSFLWVRADKSPGAGPFKFIHTSYISHVLGGGGGGPKDKGMPDMAKMKGGPEGPPQQGGQQQGDKRANWKPIGAIPSVLFGAAVGDPKRGGQFQPIKMGNENVAPKGDPEADAGSAPPRTEFFLLFVWTEPILGESDPTNTKR
jgi:type IV pilus assembly protein PilM